MRIQSSSKESRWCNCGKQILTTDMRFIDNGVHVCIECRNKESKNGTNSKGNITFALRERLTAADTKLLENYKC